MRSTFGLELKSQEPLGSNFHWRTSATDCSSLRFSLTPLESAFTRTSGCGVTPSSNSGVQFYRRFEAKLFVCSYLHPLWQLPKIYFPQNQWLAASFAKHPGGGG